MIDLQTFMNNAMAAQRSAVLANSPQLTLGELILKLKPIVEKYASKEQQPFVVFDFGTAIPTVLDSWRGSYSELALGYTLSGRDNYKESWDQVEAGAFLKHLEDAVGETYTGWKGGEYKMNKNTPVWVANPGNAGNTAIIEVVDDEYQVILMTRYCEF